MRSVIMLLCLVAAVLAPALAQSNYIPYELGGDNYYTLYGSPELAASIAGTKEFERGDTVTLYVDVTNYGRVLGFKDDQNADDQRERMLKSLELQEEYKKTTALGIIATMFSNSSEIEVKSGDQVVESLMSGDKTEGPLKFTITIGSHAPAGEYPLYLKVAYDYQSNVRVHASGIETDGGVPSLTGFRASYIYETANQTVPLSIRVKSAADFDIVGAGGRVAAGEKKAPIDVTFKNIGDETVKDAIARLSIFKPFSSTDDQAYIGSMEPGEEKTVAFRLDIDSDATPKEYGINSEIKYTDLKGDTVISESMKIPVTVEEGGRSMTLPVIALLVIVMALGGYVYKRKKA